MGWFEKCLGDGKYSDIEVVCGRRSWKAHRMVICTKSGYFETACESIGAGGGGRTIRLDKEDDPALIEVMLYYMYSGKLEIPSGLYKPDLPINDENRPSHPSPAPVSQASQIATKHSSSTGASNANFSFTFCAGEKSAFGDRQNETSADEDTDDDVLAFFRGDLEGSEDESSDYVSPDKDEEQSEDYEVDDGTSDITEGAQPDRPIRDGDGIILHWVAADNLENKNDPDDDFDSEEEVPVEDNFETPVTQSIHKMLDLFLLAGKYSVTGMKEEVIALFIKDYTDMYVFNFPGSSVSIAGKLYSSPLLSDRKLKDHCSELLVEHIRRIIKHREQHVLKALQQAPDLALDLIKGLSDAVE